MTLLTMPLMSHVIWMRRQIYHPPQKLGRQIPSIFCRGYHRDDSQNAANFVKIWRLVSEIFLIPKLFFSGPPLQGVQMIRFYFSVLKGPNCTKNLNPSGLLFWRYKGSKFQLSHHFPKISRQIPSIFCTEYHMVTQRTLKVLWKSREHSFQDIRHFILRAYRLSTKILLEQRQ